MEISFKANFVNNSKVLKYNKNKCAFYAKNVSFVKLDSENKSDMKALKTIADNWTSGYAASIYNNFNLNPIRTDLYALTTQRKNYDKLKPNNILGLAHTSEDNTELYVYHLQTNPAYIYNDSYIEEGPYIKHVGTAILNSLKEIANDKTIRLYPIYPNDTFYLKNDFVPDESLDGYFYWSKNPIDKDKHFSII